MADLSTLPLTDCFETTLAQQYTGGLGTMYVNDTPDFTFPSGVKTYAVVNPGKSIQQVVEIDSMGVGTLNVSSVTVEKGAGVDYTAQTHSANNKVIISDNYQFWKDIRTAINTKLDDDGGNGKEYADTAARDAALGGDGAATKNYRMVKAGSAYYNYNMSANQWQIVSTGTAPLNASETVNGTVELATAAQRGTSTSVGETGARLVPSNDALVKTSSGAGDENKIPVLGTTGKFDIGFLPSSDSLFGNGTDGVQPDSNLVITGSDNTFITKNFSSWTAGSVARTVTITPKNCCVWIKIQGDANFTNWTFNFQGAGGPGGAQQNSGIGNVGISGNNNKYYALTVNGTGGALGATSATGGTGGAKLSNSLNTSLFLIDQFNGAGGGSGGSNPNGGSFGGFGGAGGAGGGSIIITIGGDVVFTSSALTVAGANGSTGTNGTGGASGGGGGGGGGGGTAVVLYRGTATGSLTPTVSGGSGGTGGTGGGTTAGAGGGAGGSLFNAGTNGSNTSSSSTGGAGGTGGAGVHLIQKI